MASSASESTPGSTPLAWLVTGTSSGLGAALVPAHLADPDRVCVHALDIVVVAGALTALVAECARVWGCIEVVVNNTGAGFPGCSRKAVRRQPPRHDGCFSAGERLVVIVGTARKPELPVHRSRCAVRPRNLISSERVPSPYAASKAALHALAGTLAAELAPLNNPRPRARAQRVPHRGLQLSEAYHTANVIVDYD
ncbi:hypothetical protein B0H15DRAFT_968598 [Mycena belliarum]|uniref:Uncharacterized protein n=1 Tax=Mycena belliarum TaxID=1033014 RepID=A0AAD6TMX5_9AGAR|nr:hypothetical protein B0H15DRAFT_968598 [Mycena belliae]